MEKIAYILHKKQNDLCECNITSIEKSHINTSVCKCEYMGLCKEEYISALIYTVLNTLIYQMKTIICIHWYAFNYSYLNTKIIVIYKLFAEKNNYAKVS